MLALNKTNYNNLKGTFIIAIILKISFAFINNSSISEEGKFRTSLT